MAGIEDIKTLFLDSIATYFAINYHRNIRSITYIFEVENTNMRRAELFQNKEPVLNSNSQIQFIINQYVSFHICIFGYLFIFWAICN